MNTNRMIAVFTFMVFSLAFIALCRAQEPDVAPGSTLHDEGHSEYHDFYMDWLRPDTHTSCCNMRKLDSQGNRISGDCYPTEALPVLDKDGKFSHWRAKKDDGTW